VRFRLRRVTAFTDRRFPLRAYGGAWAGQLRWGKLTNARVLGVLKNPCYAGAYVHGRYTSRRSVEPDGTVRTGLIERPRAQWPVLIHDHHEGYLTWADYLANETKLAANRTNAGARPPREGSALCQGIIACGSCGKPMRTNYHTDQRPSYECSRRADGLTTSTCPTSSSRLNFCRTCDVSAETTTELDLHVDPRHRPPAIFTEPTLTI
jgi:recombinase-like zinc beta ribbon protein/recombinase